MAEQATGFSLPLRRIAELGEAEAGEGFAFAGEKLLHQAFLMSLQRLHFPPLRRDQLVQRRQTVGDLLLLFDQRETRLRCLRDVSPRWRKPSSLELLS